MRCDLQRNWKIRFWILSTFFTVTISLGSMVFNNWNVALAQSKKVIRQIKGPSLDNKGESLQFGELFPDRQGYTIEDIIITQNSNRSVPLKVSITGFRHEDTNFPLNPQNWCKLSPSQGVVTANQPFRFNFGIRFPKKMPSGIPDGLYVGKIKIDSPDAIGPLWIPFEFTLDLPDFKTVPGNLAEDGLTLEISCCIPGFRKASFGLITDAMSDQSVRIVAPLTLKNDMDGEVISPEKAWVELDAKGASEANQIIRAGKQPTHIGLRAHVADPNLNNVQYSGELAIRSELGRTLYIPLFLSIAPNFLVEKIKNYALIASAFFLIFFIVGPIRRLVAGRNRFMGNHFRMSHLKGNYRVPSPWNNILNVVFIPDRNAWQITPKNHFGLKSIPSSPSDMTNSVTLEKTKGDGKRPVQIQLIRGSERYLLQWVRQTERNLELSVRESRYRRGRTLLIAFICIVLLAMSVASAIEPQFWCRFIS